MKTLLFLVDVWPVAAGLVVWAVSIERRLARIQADLCWIKKRLEE